jgi:hypothetical protein
MPGYKEGKNSHATPTPCSDGEQLYVVFSDGSIAALDFAGGVLWTNREVSFFTASGFVAPTLRTVRTGGQGDVTATHIAWEQRKGVPMQASPLYVKPYLYAVTDAGIVTCYRAALGEMA